MNIIQLELYLSLYQYSHKIQFLNYFMRKGPPKAGKLGPRGSHWRPKACGRGHASGFAVCLISPFQCDAYHHSHSRGWRTLRFCEADVCQPQVGSDLGHLPQAALNQDRAQPPAWLVLTLRLIELTLVSPGYAHCDSKGCTGHCFVNPLLDVQAGGALDQPPRTRPAVLMFVWDPPMGG